MVLCYITSMILLKKEPSVMRLDLEKLYGNLLNNFPEEMSAQNDEVFFSGLERSGANLVDVLPKPEESDSYVLEAKIDYLSDRSFSYMYKSEADVKENLIVPMVISHSVSTSAHFTKRSGWKCYQLIYTNAGEATILIGDRMYVLHPGSLFLLDCLPYHYFYASSPSGWDYSFIHFGGPGCAYLCKNALEVGPLFEDAYDSEACGCFDRILTLSHADGENFEMDFHSLMTQILVSLAKGGRPLAAHRDIPSWLGDVQAYIAANYNREIRVEELASISYLSTSRFSHRYTELTGEAPIEHQMRLRTEHAKCLLESGQLSIEGIAELTGFKGTAGFYASFRKLTGTTPGEYRKRFQKTAQK